MPLGWSAHNRLQFCATNTTSPNAIIHTMTAPAVAPSPPVKSGELPRSMKPMKKPPTTRVTSYRNHCHQHPPLYFGIDPSIAQSFRPHGPRPRAYALWRHWTPPFCRSSRSIARRIDSSAPIFDLSAPHLSTARARLGIVEVESREVRGWSRVRRCARGRPGRRLRCGARARRRLTS